MVLMARNVLKFAAGGLALVALGVGVLYSIQFFKYRASPEYRAEQYFKDLERRYREDPYGGTTPEETLQLFIDALKKGDIELASKYFVLDEQKKWLKELKEIEAADQLSRLVKNIETALENKTIVSETTAHFEYTEHFSGGTVELRGQKLNAPVGDITQIVEISYYPQNRKWKITGF